MGSPARRRVVIRYRVELGFDVLGTSEFLLNVHAARTAHQRVLAEAFSVSPACAVRVDTDGLAGNRIARFAAEQGRVQAVYSGEVEIAHALAEPRRLAPTAFSEIPTSVLRYLYPSRYVPADLIQTQAWQLFGNMARGYDNVRAMRDWVEQNLKFMPGTSGTATTALDTLRDRAGVCRDFAHLLLAFCRALNYPARFVTGVDYGAAPSLGPPDFHAYVEVYIGSRWYLFDPTGISPVMGLIRIGTGRDAADASFATIFGPTRPATPIVSFAAVDDPASGVALPEPTGLAVSTAS
jgi:transglutaminase-like putative cysteine protease